MTREEAERELIDGRTKNNWFEIATDERIARRQAEAERDEAFVREEKWRAEAAKANDVLVMLKADFADARREVERLEKQRLLDYDYSTELIAQAREKALDEAAQLVNELREDSFVAQAIRALKHQEEKP